MKAVAPILAIALVSTLTPFASASVFVDLTDGTCDSGWRAVLPDGVNVGIVVDKVTDSYVRIEITKNFTQPPVDGYFLPISILFEQMACAGATVPTIQITDETITNNTGADWTDYHWQINGCLAAFDIRATEGSGFSVDPFTEMTWTPKCGWGSDYASALDLAGGLVAPGETFAPGVDSGKLYVDVQLDDCKADFCLIQYPTPEPGTIFLLAAGGLFALLRHRRERSAFRRWARPAHESR